MFTIDQSEYTTVLVQMYMRKMLTSTNLIGKYPIIAIVTIASLVFLVGPIIFSLIIAGIIVLPMYLAVQLFGDKE